MNKKLSMAVAGAVMAFGASAANAGITIPAGDWTIDIGGNVNAFYTHTSFDDNFEVNGEENKGAFGSEDANVVQTGLLPSALGIGGKTRQNDLDIAFQFTFFTGADSGTGAGAGNNTLNIRQAYMTFGDKSWGTIKLGRDLGIYGSDAILSDMTLLGVGIGAGRGGSSTLGRIGSGYQYADWVGQISYASPNWNGFSFAAGVREPWSNGADNTRSNLGYEGKASYEWGGDVAGKVWVGYISQKHEKAASVNCTSFSSHVNTATGAPICLGTTTSFTKGYTSDGWEIGGKVAFGGLSLVGYYYDGEGLSGDLGTLATNLTLNGVNFLANSSENDDQGGYVQAVYALPGVGTKIGASWGISKSEIKDSNAEYENESWMVGVYHPLTKSLNLVAEYVDQDVSDIGGVKGADGEAKTVALGAIMFF